MNATRYIFSKAVTLQADWVFQIPVFEHRQENAGLDIWAGGSRLLYVFCIRTPLRVVLSSSFRNLHPNSFPNFFPEGGRYSYEPLKEITHY
jgi:hypothetical protein